MDVNFCELQIFVAYILSTKDTKFMYIEFK